MMLFRAQLCAQVLWFAVIGLVLGGGVPALAQNASGDRAGVATNTVMPKVGYRLDIRLLELPAPVARVSAWAQYAVSNAECVPVDQMRAPGGLRLPPEERKDLALELLDGAYFTTVYEDALVDRDLFGLGVCRWALQSVTVAFASAATKFVGGATVEQLRSGAPTTKYYLVRDFRERPAVGDQVFGEAPGFYKKSLGAQFSLTIASRLLQ
ncbi:MAG: hypothetical protein HOO99_12355 [Hyphomicrobiaceae bacterium]|nr:hypothetical protein [Hyphomicrobiaceae bacterium]